MDDKAKIVILVGPTAVGKTSLALSVAPELNAEIISADSRLFYKGMDIGTAKPTCEELLSVKHHLIDIADPDEVISLGTYRILVAEKIAEITTRGRIPLLVGGTGQYIRAVVEGWTVPGVEPDPRLRKVLESLQQAFGLELLLSWLKKLDPQYYGQVDRQNHRRIIRALEVILTTGYPLSIQRKKEPSPYQYLMIGLRRDRAELYQRIDERIDMMIAAGLINEVQKLIDQGFSTSLPSMSAIGYQEIAMYLQGGCSLNNAITLIKRRTHLFVRRQANWFKDNDRQIHWIDTGEGTKSEFIELVHQYLLTGERDAS